MPAIHLLWGTVLLLLTACQSMESAHHNKWAEGDALAIAVDSAENREFSYTDKKSGYYYATTHSEENNMWFAGWNIAGKRIFSDYRKITSTETFSPDPALSARLKTWHDLFKNTGFAKPYLQPNLKSLQYYHEVELTY